MRSQAVDEIAGETGAECELAGPAAATLADAGAVVSRRGIVGLVERDEGAEVKEDPWLEPRGLLEAGAGARTARERPRAARLSWLFGGMTGWQGNKGGRKERRKEGRKTKGT